MTTIFVSLDQGLAMAYFLETDLLRLLADRPDSRLVILVPEEMLDLLASRYARPGVIFESMRNREAARYQREYFGGLQYNLEYLRRASASRRIPLTYVDTHRQRKEAEAENALYLLYLKSLRPILWINRRSRLVRMAFRRLSSALFTPHIYDDLFERYRPDLVVANTAGWRLDQYLLREAHRRGIRTLTFIVGWDNPSSQGLPGAFVDYATVWSAEHKRELVEGVDWPAENVHIGGMPLYDGYFSRRWVIPREEYFRQHGLDPAKKLIAFAATALSISPNLHIIRELAGMVARQEFGLPTQLLIRLHPNHFKDQPHYRDEMRAIRELTAGLPDVHVVEPREMPGGLERYSGEDYPEKSSMLAHCDVLVTIYSTMVVEAAAHGKPFVSACIDTDQGWPGKFWVPLHEVPTWPTASRVNAMKAGKLALTPEQLRQAVRAYLLDPTEDEAARRAFLQRELTYTDGSATRRTAEFIWSVATGAFHGAD